MSRKTRWVRDLLAMCEIEGAVVLSWEKNKHIKIRIQTPFGERLFVASGTTTDPHSIHNNRSIVRRLVKTGGLQMSQKVEVSSGVGFFGALFLLFLALKLTSVIDWSWWWVTAPLWAPTAVAITLIALLLIAGLIATLIERRGKS